MSTRNFGVGRLLAVILFLCAILNSGSAQGDDPLVEFHGTVHDSSNHQPVVGASVIVEEAHRGAVTHRDGTFTIGQIPTGTYTIVVKSAGYHEQRFRFMISPRATIVVELEPKTTHLGSVTVMGRRDGLAPSNQSTTLIGEEQLREHRGGTFGEALKDVTGVTLLQTGPTISKPVIRGLHSQRLVILNNNLRQEGSQWGSEHAPEIDPFAAGGIEVIKGASSVEYGSDAIGGVIRVEPRSLATVPGLGGEAIVNAFSNSRQVSTSILLQDHHPDIGGASWRVQGSYRISGDAAAPHYVLSNTGSRELNGSATIGVDGETTSWQIMAGHFGTELGIFAGSHIANTTDLERAIASPTPLVVRPFTYEIGSPRQVVSHNSVAITLRSQISDIGRLDLHAGWQQNRRQEFDVHKPWSDSLRGLVEGRPAFDLTLTTYNLNATLNHLLGHGFVGKLGVDVTRQGNVSGGTNIFIPNYRLYSAGIFALEQWLHDEWVLEAGGRFDHRSMAVYLSEDEKVREELRTYTNISGTVGAIYKASDEWSIGTHIGTGWRAPSINELYANGLHHGTATYEIGDPHLEREQTTSADLTLRHQSDWMQGEASIYVMSFSTFIQALPQPEPTLTVRGAFPTFRFSSTEGTMRGIDGSLRCNLTPEFSLIGSIAIVRGTGPDGNPLYGIPADRGSLRGRLNGTTLAGLDAPWIEAGITGVARQRNVPAEFDYAAPPAGYGLVSVAAGATVELFGTRLTMNLSIDNLFDKSYRDYLSRFRYFSDDVGRNLALRLSLLFGSSTATTTD